MSQELRGKICALKEQNIVELNLTVCCPKQVFKSEFEF